VGYKWGMTAMHDSNGALRGRTANVKIRRDGSDATMKFLLGHSSGAAE
jgi:hypothetical protein